ncbi:MAG: hypothetical protein CEE38_01760 [Planctomycetes bacterium B3_Pla]|nr:MAG: hypothetical protein CEE38_01760 [Planctomycetes bacterium B3_Pla]
MRRWFDDTGALGLIREKNRLGIGSNLGSLGGNSSLRACPELVEWGARTIFTVVWIVMRTCALLRRTIFYS